MEDIQIITLFWRRDERAITEFERAYKRLCLHIHAPQKRLSRLIATTSFGI